jgi:hypothetical protein
MYVMKCNVRGKKQTKKKVKVICGWGSEGIFFLFDTVSRLALGPSQPPIQCVSGALSAGIKRPGRKADH